MLHALCLHSLVGAVFTPIPKVVWCAVSPSSALLKDVPSPESAAGACCSVLFCLVSPGRWL